MAVSIARHLGTDALLSTAGPGTHRPADIQANAIAAWRGVGAFRPPWRSRPLSGGLGALPETSTYDQGRKDGAAVGKYTAQVDRAKGRPSNPAPPLAIAPVADDSHSAEYVNGWFDSYPGAYAAEYPPSAAAPPGGGGAPGMTYPPGGGPVTVTPPGALPEPAKPAASSSMSVGVLVGLALVAGGAAGIGIAVIHARSKSRVRR
jgi:hypothetical protein